jgi:hypothetical protein
VPSQVEQEKTKKLKQETRLYMLYERRKYDEMVVNACLRKHIKDPYKEKLRDAIRNRVDSYPMSVIKASLGVMHMAREMYEDVAHTETVEIPDEFSTRPLFVT